MTKLIIFDLWNTLAYKTPKGSFRHFWQKVGRKKDYKKAVILFTKYFETDKSKNLEVKCKSICKELNIHFDNILILLQELSNYFYYFFYKHHPK